MSEGKNDGHVSQGTAGAYTLAEILSQPECWAKCLQHLEASGTIESIQKSFVNTRECIFVGCGSSYYIGMAAASAWSELTGQRARALPASEIMLSPELSLTGSADFVAVLISRSGRTSEVLRAGELLRKKGIRTVAITCAAGQPLEKLATHTILLPAADEQSTVMTRSFTSMLLALQYMAALLGDRRDLLASLDELSTATESMVRKLAPRVRDFTASKPFEDYVCLGQGPYYGLACESALKLSEMSCSYGQGFHTLEFRHGPKSIVSPRTLIAFLLSERHYAAELEILEEVKNLGGATLVVANKADARVRSAADFLVELALPGPELARLAPYVVAGQLMGLYTGLKKGLDPDRPRNLSRVVILKEDRPQHAAI